MQNKMLLIGRYEVIKDFFNGIKTCMSDIIKFRMVLSLREGGGEWIIERYTEVFKLHPSC